MNLAFEIGIPLALVLVAALGFYLLRRLGEHLDKQDHATQTSSM